MARPRTPRPTDAELLILRILWKRGASTVRELYDEIVAQDPDKQSAYTTTLTMLQIMTEKGLVCKENAPNSRAHLYHAAARESETQQSLVKDLMDRAFGGSMQKLVMHALSADGVSEQELQKVKRMLDKIEDTRK